MICTKIMKKLLSSIVCLLMTVAMILPAAVTFDVYGLDSSTTQQSAEAETQEDADIVIPETSKRVTVGDYDITFKEAVVTSELLDSTCSTNTLVTKANRKSIKLTWKAVKNKSGISGYFIVRKNNSNGRWYQIATVGKSKLAYTDKSAKKKNVLYSYTLVPYFRADGYVWIADPSQWAASVTKRSSKNNADKIKIKRAALASAVRVGGSTKVTMVVTKKLNKKPFYSKKLRWSSSNSKVAKVSSTGRITGKKTGTATISARTHTGYVLKFKIKVVKSGTASGMLDVMRSWMGYSYYNQKNRGIVDIYNSFEPLPSGYKMSYYDAWCDCCISAAAIVSGNEDKIGRNCYVPGHVNEFKKRGIWINGCKAVPQPGDIIVFNWSPKDKSNASHIGIVEAVDGDTITTIEGNMGIGIVGRRTIKVGWKYIKGYARPNYILEGSGSVTPQEPAAPENPDNTAVTGSTQNG